MNKIIYPCVHIRWSEAIVEQQQIKTFNRASRTGSLFKVSTFVTQHDEGRALTNDVSDAVAAAFATF